MNRTFISVLTFCSLAACARAEDSGLQFFENKIRPLLADQCYGCHSVKAKKVKGKLFADSREALLKGGETGPAFVPGAPEKSRLIEAVAYKNQDLQMPPDSKLTDAQIADLTEWVKLGAPWPAETPPKAEGGALVGEFNLEARKAKHWAWQPLAATAPPAVSDAAWVKDPLDAFILQKLEAAKFKPAREAAKAVLLRRATFDLTGLPPTPAELDAFLADNAPNAFETVVERLLASPRFGERWARHWLDLVRYAESHGHEFDFSIPNAYQYRDYVIRALNADVPYNVFATEHLAGDLLEQPRFNDALKLNESAIAPGFLMLGEDVQAPVDVRQHQADRLDNMIDIVGKTFSGLTIACARCHDHKFDAISTADYYALYGFLKSSRYSQLALNQREIDGRVKELTVLKKELGAASFAALKTQCADLPAALAAWKPAKKLDAANPLQLWLAAQKSPVELKAKFAAPHPPAITGAELGFLLEESAFMRGAGFVPGADPKRPIAELRDTGWLSSDLISRRLQGSARSATFKLDKKYIHLLAKGDGARIGIVIDNFTLIRSPIYGGLRRQVKSTEPKWTSFDVAMWQGHEAYIEINDTTTPFPGEEGQAGAPESFVAVKRVLLSDGAAPADDTGRAASALLQAKAGAAAPESDALATLIRDAAREALEKCGADGACGSGEAELLSALLEQGLLDLKPADDVTALFKKYRELEAALPQPIRAPGIVDGTGSDESIFIRGGHRTLGPRTARRFLTALHGEAVDAPGSGRLELARQVTDAARNPLFARVIVNRLWQHLFGRGIVASVDNFGVLGTLPTHPELLDFLTQRFVKDGFSIKTALRKMMLSSSYRMDSAPNAAAATADPANDLLSHQRMKRLEGESIRDALLLISGRLDEKLLGPSIDVHLTAFMTGRGRPNGGPLDGGGRRSIYTAVRRNFLPPMMLAFDTPVPFSTMGRRTVSNVPSQALILLNDPFVVAQADTWAARARKVSPEFNARAANMYRAAFAREPLPGELDAAKEYIAEQLKQPGANEQTAWKNYAHVLINLKEFIFIK